MPITIPTTAAVVVGIPVGIALGRVLWDLFAADINAVPSPSVPGGTVLVDGSPPSHWRSSWP
jgi:hypothetical protein